jgi:glycosyltransferase involved in cell wall biosynthesis
VKRPPARVWLEATHTLSSRGRGRTGVGHYTEELIAHLLAADPKRVYTVVGNVFMAAMPALPRVWTNNVRFRLCRLFPGKVWNQLFKRGLMLPLNWLIPGRPDLVVFFNFVRYPVTPGVKTITAIHDLAYLKFPEAVQGRNRRYLRRFVPKAAERSDHLITVSEAMKREITEEYGVAADRISVVYPGVDLQHFSPTLMTAAVRQKLELPERYFLFVSTLEPRKNVLGLLRAYRGLPKEIRRDYGLVLTGPVGWLADDIMAEVSKGDAVGHVMRTSYVSHEEMPQLFSGATAYVMPSLYEGFGMTPVEAMACGTPVITSDNTAMPESVGDAGILLPAEDTAGFTAAMERVARDDSLRERMRRAGLERARLFSWERSARALKAVIDRVLAE